MTDLCIPWAPRLILRGRTFRLPVVASNHALELEPSDFQVLDRRWSERDRAFFYYLRAPDTSGAYVLCATQQDQSARVEIQVRSLDELRRPHPFNHAQ